MVELVNFYKSLFGVGVYGIRDWDMYGTAPRFLFGMPPGAWGLRIGFKLRGVWHEFGIGIGRRA